MTVHSYPPYDAAWYRTWSRSSDLHKSLCDGYPATGLATSLTVFGQDSLLVWFTRRDFSLDVQVRR